MKSHWKFTQQEHLNGVSLYGFLHLLLSFHSCLRIKTINWLQGNKFCTYSKIIQLWGNTFHTYCMIIWLWGNTITSYCMIDGSFVIVGNYQSSKAYAANVTVGNDQNTMTYTAYLLKCKIWNSQRLIRQNFERKHFNIS